MNNKKIGFTCGTMDLLHAGHVLMLKEARNNCDHLIVGVQTDPSIDRAEKNKPIQSLEERIIQVEGCKYVDDILIYETEEDLHTMLTMLSHKHERNLIRFIGMDWLGKKYTGHELPIEMHFNQRDHSYSSSELRNRIYDAELCKRFKS